MTAQPARKSARKSRGELTVARSPEHTTAGAAYVASGRIISERAGMQRDAQGRVLTEHPVGTEVNKLLSPNAPTATVNSLAKFTTVGGALGDSAVSEVSGNVGIGTTNPAGPLEIEKNSIGATSTDGLIVENATAATAGVPMQVSPRLRLTGQGWKSDATAASRTLDWVFENVPLPGASTPSSYLRIANQVNGGGYNEVMQIYRFPTGNPPNQVSILGAVTAGSGGGFSFYDNPSDAIFQVNGNRGMHFWQSALGGSNLYISSVGNIGIGTGSPTSKLTVAGLIHSTSSGIKFPDNTTQTTAFNGANFVQKTGDTMTGTLILSSGKLGIGITNPANKLDVVYSNGSAATAAVKGTTSVAGSYGVWGESTVAGGYGVFGGSNISSASNYGVFGQATGNGYAVKGVLNNPGVDGYAGHFSGRVGISGTLEKSGGSFKIDHPLDPANKYLYHSFVESPDMMNIYNGNVTTDAAGEAVVALPDYFESLNRDFRYQLTVIGQFAQAIIGGKIKDSSFTIKTDKPNVEVSWQVTGIRRDAYAEAHRIQVEEEKPERERGSYLHPEVHGQPEEKGVEWARNPEMMRQLKQQREKAEKGKKSN